MLERRLERAGSDLLNTPRVLERLNSLVLYRYETDDKPKLYWQEIPKEDRLLILNPRNSLVIKSKLFGPPYLTTYSRRVESQPISYLSQAHFSFLQLEDFSNVNR